MDIFPSDQSEHLRIARCSVERPRSAKAPKRSLAAIRAEAASRVTAESGVV